MKAARTFKGFDRCTLLDRFGVVETSDGVVVPYLRIGGELYREKLFSADGRPQRWLGDSRPQIPYALESFAGTESRVCFLTEGESCSWTLRLSCPGVPVLGVPGASSWRPGWAMLLRRFERIYLSFDHDEAGIKLLDMIWPSIPWARRVLLPEGQDTRGFIQAEGLSAYRELIEKADYTDAALAYILGREGVRNAA